MTSKTWTSGTVVDSPWLQDVNDVTYTDVGGVGGLSNTSNTAKGDALLGTKRTFTNSVGQTLHTYLEKQAIDATQAGCVFDNSTDDTSAMNVALTAASTAIAGATGQEIALPNGTAIVSSQMTLPNRVVVRGKSKRGSIFKASASHSGPWMFNAVNGTSSMFDNPLERLTLNCNNVAGLGGVLSDAWQEGGGMRDVLVENFRTYGLKIQNGYGGAALLELDQVELFGSNTAAATAGILMNQISSIGSFMLHISNSTIAGGPAVGMARGIDIVKDSLYCQNVHFEYCTSGIYLDGPGHHVLIGVTGGPSVTNVVEIASTFTGTLRMLGCHRATATNIIKDNRVGGLGTLPSIDTDFYISSKPIFGPGYVNACGKFDGTSGASPAITNCFGLTSISRTGTGIYTVTMTWAMNSSMYPIMVTGKLAGGSASAIASSTSTFEIRTYNSAGALTNDDEINFTVVRNS